MTMTWGRSGWHECGGKKGLVSMWGGSGWHEQLMVEVAEQTEKDY
jgi:hypothetical protein